MGGLFDYEYQLELINQHQPPLQKLDAVIDWELFRAPIEGAFRIEPKGPGDRPPFDRLHLLRYEQLARLQKGQKLRQPSSSTVGKVQKIQMDALGPL